MFFISLQTRMHTFLGYDLSTHPLLLHEKEKFVIDSLYMPGDHGYADAVDVVPK
jgi:hypothetical protein